MNWKTHKKLLIKNSEFKKALKETELEYSIARSIIEARTRKGITQKKLAMKLHTKQSVISRIEHAKTTPSLSFLKRIAKTFKTPLRVEFGP